MKRLSIVAFVLVLFAGSVYAGKKLKIGKIKKSKAPVQTAAGVLFTFEKADADSVAVAGDFNNWAADKNLLKKNKNGIWCIVLPLKKGEYGYKFVVNGSEWVADPKNKATKDDGFGGVNSLLKVTKKYDLGGVKVLKNGKVLFKFYGPAASKVALAGSFNDWSKDANLMKKNKKGFWVIKLKLDPGTYQYKYVVNDKDWVTDPQNENTSDDGMGGKNSVVEIQ